MERCESDETRRGIKVGKWERAGERGRYRQCRGEEKEKSRLENMEE